jgi:hypothetical protein
MNGPYRMGDYVTALAWDTLFLMLCGVLSRRE